MKNKGSFLKGALVGALATCIIMITVGGGIIHAITRKNEGVVDPQTLQKLTAIREMIDQKYLYGEEINEAVLNEMVIKGYVAGLGDPYSVYYNQEETVSLYESTSGEFTGIGVALSQDPETKLITLTTVYEDSPGEKAGLLDGDILYKVDGKDVSTADLDTVVSKIRGEKGTKVKLTVLRGSDLKEYTCEATRDKIEVNTVFSEMKADQTGYIRVSGFELVTSEQFEKALKALQDQGMESLIIDLRSNPGGNMSTVCEMLDLILPKGTIVYTEDKYGKRDTWSSDDEHQLNLPMAVLIDGNSASAAEIFAGAIQDYGVGTLVGTTTFGKGIVQNLYTMTDGTCLKITTSEYFTPNGRNIHGKGIEPDVVVEYQYDEKHPEADNQLDAAMEILRK